MRAGGRSSSRECDVRAQWWRWGKLRIRLLETPTVEGLDGLISARGLRIANVLHFNLSTFINVLILVMSDYYYYHCYY